MTRKQAFINLRQALVAFASMIGVAPDHTDDPHALVLDGAGDSRYRWRLEQGGQPILGMTRYSAAELERMLWFATAAFKLREQNATRFKVKSGTWEPVYGAIPLTEDMFLLATDRQWTSPTVDYFLHIMGKVYRRINHGQPVHKVTWEYLVVEGESR